MNAALNLAAAAGGTAANVALNRFGNWMSQSAQPLNNMGQMRQALPNVQTPQRGRGRGRRGRGRRGQGRPGGQPRSGVQTRGGEVSVCQGTEVLGAVAQGFKTYIFNPSPDELTRLKAMEKMYTRFRVKYVNVAYKSGSGTATAGNVAVGVAVGPAQAEIKDATTVMKLRPSFFVPAWKNASLTVGADIDLGRYMLCGDDKADGVAFTLYVYSTAANLGMLQVSYKVEFSHPRPF